jgi:hypothetical protein
VTGRACVSLAQPRQDSTCQLPGFSTTLPAMPRIQRQKYHDIERIIEFDFVRATEAAALNSLQWLGRGEKEKADAAA